jgi:tripartite motif-containing protein 71
MKTRVILIGLLPLIFLAAASWAEDPPLFLLKWGTPGSGDGQFSEAIAVAIDDNDNVYVAERSNHRVQKFTSSGAFIGQWGVLGSGDGQFNSPNGVAVDDSSNVYVADTYNHCIQKFTSDGTFLAKWGSQGAGDGQFEQPWDVAVDDSSNVYVTDSYNHRIQKFTSDGVFLTKWGSQGTGNGQFDRPLGIAVDGNVYVTELQNNRVQKFTSDGTFVGKWGSFGTGNGEFSVPVGIAADGNVYVADTNNHRIQKFTSDGTFLTVWGSSGTGDGQFNTPHGIDVDDSGCIYVADTFNNRIQKFRSNVVLESPPPFLLKWGTPGSGDGQFNEAIAVAIDDNDNVYVAERSNHRLQKFTSSGAFIRQWGVFGSGDGQFNSPNGVAVDDSGSVYVADTYNHRIQKFTSDGTFLAKWGSQGAGDGQFEQPWDVAEDDSGNVYVTDSYNHRIQKFTSDGTFLTKWGSQGTGDGQFSRPLGIAVDGNVYVTELFNNRVQKFTSDGTFVGKWGSAGTGNGQFNVPVGIAADGNVFVADQGNNRIQKFTSGGTFLTVWGSGGAGDGQFSAPHGIDVDDSGCIYVADTFNNRIQRFGFLEPAPMISSVADVPGDQGGMVAVNWMASGLDFTGMGISHYSVWRALEALPSGALSFDGSTEVVPADVVRNFQRSAYRVEYTSSGDFYWEWVANQDAYWFAGYSMTCPTLLDSTANNRGIHYFQVMAHSTGGDDFWASAPDSGYSVDNLAPQAPQQLSGEYLAGTTTLHWMPNTEADLAQYRLYRGKSADFVPGPENFVATQSDTGYVDTAGEPFFYKLSAVDLHGNESLFAFLQPEGTVGIEPKPDVPNRFALYPSVPNPLRDHAVIRFDLPVAAPVRLSIYDARGRVVRQAISAEQMSAGRHDWEWNGRDDAGVRLPPGMYFIGLETPMASQTRKAVVLE